MTIFRFRAALVSGQQTTLWVFAANSRDSGGKSVDSADLSAMATVFPGVCSAAAAAVGSSVAVHPTLMSIITPARWK